MIRYRLVCSEGHEFEGWFKSSAAYDDQQARSQIRCPHCGTVAVSKAIMAPSLATRTASVERIADAAPSPSWPGEEAQQLRDMMRKLRATLEKHSEYVGPRFAEEARKIYYEESSARGVYGEASPEEAKALCEEGIPILPLPRLREDLN
jgi:hypothetical protein